MKDLVSIPFRNYEESVPEALNACGAGEYLATQERVLIKPNLVGTMPPPVTTPVDCVEAIVEYVRAHAPSAEIVVAEGCGDALRETDYIFHALGYDAMAERQGVELVDLNHALLVRRENPGCTVFPEMHLPELAFTHTIISVPMLKAHSLARMTGTLKNMMGFAPPEHYSGGGGSWKKAVFHTRMQASIRDLNSYFLPHLTLMDATVGLADYHLGGATCDPPVNLLLAGADPYSIDREAARLLQLDWNDIGHLR